MDAIWAGLPALQTCKPEICIEDHIRDKSALQRVLSQVFSLNSHPGTALML